ncbi:hypothetical protein ABK040_001927 [Willaertia magna]
MELLKVNNAKERVKEKCLMKTIPLIDNDIFNNKIEYLSYGSNYFLLVTTNNNIYVYGNIKNSYTNSAIRKLQFNFKIKFLECDSHFAIFVNEKNEIYLQGMIQRVFCYNFEKIYQFINKEIKIVRCAKSTIFIVTTENLIFEYDGILKDFTIVSEMNDNIKDLQGGVDHVIYVNSSGDIYCKGDNKFGQLGLGNQIKRIEEFTKVNLNISIKSKVKKIGCYNYGTFILNNYNELYGTGFNEYFQLGLGNNLDVFTFTRIVILTTIKNIYKTHNYYTVLQDIDNNFYISGNNYLEKLGIKNVDDDWNNCLTKFTKLDFLNCDKNYDKKFNYLLPLLDNLFILKCENEIQKEEKLFIEEIHLGLQSFQMMKRELFVDIYFK